MSVRNVRWVLRGVVYLPVTHLLCGPCQRLRRRLDHLAFRTSQCSNRAETDLGGGAGLRRCCTVVIGNRLPVGKPRRESRVSWSLACTFSAWMLSRSMNSTSRLELERIWRQYGGVGVEPSVVVWLRRRRRWGSIFRACLAERYVCRQCKSTKCGSSR